MTPRRAPALTGQHSPGRVTQQINKGVPTILKEMTGDGEGVVKAGQAGQGDLTEARGGRAAGKVPRPWGESSRLREEP